MVFPCYELHEDNQAWYKGKTTFYNCKDLLKGCEWLSIGCNFITHINNEETKKYKLLKCPDKEPIVKSKQPDLEFINALQSSEKFAVEVKELHELLSQKNKDEKSFSEFADYLSLYINNNNQHLKAIPYALIVSQNIRWGKNDKNKNVTKVFKNIVRILDNGFVNYPDLSEEFEVGGIYFTFMIVDEEVAVENNIRKGVIQIRCPIFRGSTADLRPPKINFYEFMDDVKERTIKKFEDFTEHRRALLLVNKSNYINNSVCTLIEKSNLMDIEDVEIWFASPIHEEIDEYGNEEFYGEYQFKQLK